MRIAEPWTTKEDTTLLSIIKDYPKKKSWNKISKELSKRSIKKTPSSCKRRWNSVLNPENCSTRFDLNEKYQLFVLVEQHGSKWRRIAKVFGNRTDVFIKNQFFNESKKFIRKVNKLLGQFINHESIRRIKPTILSQVFDIMNCVGFRQYSKPSDFMDLLQNLGDTTSLYLKDEIKELLRRFIEELFKRSRTYNLNINDKKENQEELSESGSMMNFKMFSKNLNQKPFTQSMKPEIPREHNIAFLKSCLVKTDKTEEIDHNQSTKSICNGSKKAIEQNNASVQNGTSLVENSDDIRMDINTSSLQESLLFLESTEEDSKDWSILRDLKSISDE